MKIFYTLAFLLSVIINPVWGKVLHTDYIRSRAVSWDIACANLPQLMREAVNKECAQFGGKLSGPIPVDRMRKMPIRKAKAPYSETGLNYYYTCEQKIQFWCVR